LEFHVSRRALPTRSCPESDQKGNRQNKSAPELCQGN
jgi:hypothetical protein